MLELIGVRQSYPWGTKDAIPSLIGQAPDAKPWAEQWYGAHPLGDSPTPDGATLSEHLAQQQDQLGKAALMTFGRRLPFLMTILSAASSQSPGPPHQAAGPGGACPGVAAGSAAGSPRALLQG